MKKYSLIGIIILSVFFGAFRWKSGEDPCMDIVKEYVKKVSAIKPKGDQVCYLDLAIETVSTSNLKDKTEVKMYISEKGLVYESDKFSMYQDKDDIITAIHPQKRLIWAGGKGNTVVKEGDVKAMTESQIAFLENARVASCEDVVQNGKKMKKIGLIVDEKVRDAYKAKDIVFYYNISNKFMEKVSVFFEENYMLNAQTVTYKAMDTDYKGFKFISAKERVLSKSGKPQGRYAGYNLINAKP